MITLICSMLSDPGDQVYMIDLYLQYRRLMFSTVSELIQEPETRKDIIQDSLVKLMEKISVLKTLEDYALSDYITTTVRHTSYNELKRAENRCIRFSNEEDLPLMEDPFSEEKIQLMYQQHLLSKIWEKLSADDRRLLKGKYFMEYCDEELARVLGCTVSSIRMKLTRARRRALKLMLEESGYDKT